jgi:pimeloyl-ACP methyl ester carboxylesterase
MGVDVGAGEWTPTGYCGEHRGDEPRLTEEPNMCRPTGGAGWILIAVFLAGCGAAPARPSTTSAPTGSPTARAAATASGSGLVDGTYDIGGIDLWMLCEGSGSPTVLLEAGLGGTSGAWALVRSGIADGSRVCVYDRAGLGLSDSRQSSRPVSAGTMADELQTLLGAAGQTGPFIAVGHSYGGIVARLFAHRNPDDVVGLVLVDSSSEAQFAPGGDGERWREGGVAIDGEASTAELEAATTLGSLPIVVLTQGQIGGDFERSWFALQDGLAALSTNSLHVIAHDAGHMIQDDAPDLLVEAVATVVEAARSGGSLPACGPRLEAAGAECVDGTLTAVLDGWDALRASIQPAGGSMPSGTYVARLTKDEAEAIIGAPVSFSTQELTLTLEDGRWEFSVGENGAAPDEFADVYAVDGDEVTFRFPTDWKVPRTPGVNRLAWAVDADGTLRFDQLDDWPVEPWFAIPWVRDAPSDDG